MEKPLSGKPSEKRNRVGTPAQAAPDSVEPENKPDKKTFPEKAEQPVLDRMAAEPVAVLNHQKRGNSDKRKKEEKKETQPGPQEQCLIAVCLPVCAYCATVARQKYRSTPQIKRQYSHPLPDRGHRLRGGILNISLFFCRNL